MISVEYYLTPFGELILGSFDDKLCLCDWKYRKMRIQIDDRIKSELNADYAYKTSPVIEETIRQLQEYFSGERTIFQLQLKMIGTPFQQSVWDTLCQIPYGTTTTYLDLSRKLGKEKAIRAVAAANGANALSIIVPCHRVVGRSGELVGYAGGLDTKMKLLKLENAPINDQLDLF